MKKVVTGASVLLTGALLFLSVFVAAGSLGPIGGWDESGRFWMAVSDAKRYPVFTVSVITMIAGIVVLFGGISINPMMIQNKQLPVRNVQVIRSSLEITII